MIDKLYYYFIKTKYSKFNTDDLMKMREIHNQSKKFEIRASSISFDKKSAIEIGLIGRELSLQQRHVDSFILENDFIIESFIEDELGFEKGLRRLSGNLAKTTLQDAQ